MTTQKAFSCCKLIITCLFSLLITLFCPLFPDIQAKDEEKRVEVSSFDEFASSLNQMQSTGGTIVLTQDITVPDGEYCSYNNARYRKEVVVETSGYTIYVEGDLDLWPFLTIRGNGSQNELFHVSSGGDLRLVSICLDAGEDGIAVVQEEGSFLIYGSAEDMGLPAFTCTGQIISSQTMTAAAYWRYNCEKLPIVRVPEGAEFTADMLPDQVLSVVNRDHQEHEEEIPVIWDDTTFPTEHERTLVRGKFADGYSQYDDYVPQCLVIWESDTSPFFLNVYLESATQWYDMVFMYGESSQPGTIYVQSSEDGEIWTDIAGTDGYVPVEAEQNESFSWILSYDRSDPAQERPRYYRMLQVLDDGTELYSDALELSDNLIFTAADIEGGRGGETSPNEGENQLPNDLPETEDEAPALESPGTSSESGTGSGGSEQPESAATESDSHSDDGDIKEFSKSNNSPAGDSLQNDTSAMPQLEGKEVTAQASGLEEDSESAKPDEAEFITGDENLSNAGTEKIVGIVIVVCILAGSVAFFVFKRKR